MKNDFLSKEKKMDEFLNLQFYDNEIFLNLTDFFHFGTEDLFLL